MPNSTRKLDILLYRPQQMARKSCKNISLGERLQADDLCCQQKASLPGSGGSILFQKTGRWKSGCINGVVLADVFSNHWYILYTLLF